jgi:hypothetical protein
MTDGFPAALAHGPLEEPFDGIFTVRGTSRFAPLVAITRNMIIVRHGGELTLIGTVRLSPSGERELERLGTVRHLVKLGHFHGMDDPYYVKRYSPVVWATKDALHKPGVATTEVLAPGTPGPLGSEVFVFERADKPEACLVLPRDGGILVTCDSIQNWGDFAGCTALAKLIGRAFGFAGAPQIGPGWRRFTEPKDEDGFRPDFERLLALPFRHLLPAHGVPLRDGAKEALAARVAKTYPSARRVVPT